MADSAPSVRLQLRNLSDETLNCTAPLAAQNVQFKGRWFVATFEKFPNEEGVYCYHEFQPYELTKENVVHPPEAETPIDQEDEVAA